MTELLITIAGILGLIWFSYGAGKDKVKTKHNQEMLEVLDEVRKVRNNRYTRKSLDSLLSRYGQR